MQLNANTTLPRLLHIRNWNFPEKPAFRFLMQNILSAMLLVLSGFAPQAVNANTIQEQSNYYVDVTKPSVYLRREQDYDFDQVHLRLFNNSRWAIMLRIDKLISLSDVQELRLQDGRVVSGLNDSIKILPEYFIESPLIESRVTGHYWCTASSVWIPSGQSVLFDVPMNELSKLANIYLKYRYEWQHDADESEHRINFKWIDPSLKR